MRQRVSWPVVLTLATLVHIDWHVARPTHHRLSLGWSAHWLFAIAFFAVAGWYIERRWSSAPWRAAAWNVGIALLIAQVLEPVLEAAYYEGRFGYPVDSERWIVFGKCIAAGLPALAIVVSWLTFRRAAQHGTALGAGEG
jgi:hypothetical protein